MASLLAYVAEAVVAEWGVAHALPTRQVVAGFEPAVLAEMFRVLVPGGRIGISDVVAEDHMSPADRAAAGSYAGCIAGALSRREYLDGLAAAGFTDTSVTFTTDAAPGLHSGLHSAIIRAVKPAAA